MKKKCAVIILIVGLIIGIIYIEKTTMLTKIIVTRCDDYSQAIQVSKNENIMFAEQECNLQFGKSRYRFSNSTPCNLEKVTNGKSEEIINFPSGVYFKSNNTKIINNKLIIIGQVNNDFSKVYKYYLYKLFNGTLIEGRKGEEYPVDRELIFHTCDIIYSYDMVSNQLINQYTTKQGERVIYADEDKVITYHKHKLITYSIKDWKIQGEQKATYIKNSGIYYFQVYQDNIFIYNEAYKLMDMIEV